MTGRLNIDYVEFYSSRLDDTERFFAKAFGWEFVEYGPDYRDIQNAGLGGGLERSDSNGKSQPPLIILRADDLESAYHQLCRAGAEITRDIFEFPGGLRFEFLEPGGTRMAVWSPNQAPVQQVGDAP